VVESRDNVNDSSDTDSIFERLACRWRFERKGAQIRKQAPHSQTPANVNADFKSGIPDINPPQVWRGFSGPPKRAVNPPLAARPCVGHIGP